MELKPLSPRYDVVFKNIFGEKHIPVLADFLKAVLDLPEDAYQDIQVVDPHLQRKHKSGKLGILDLRVTTKSGTCLNVELQVSPQPSIWKRILYYNARLLTDQIASGDEYDKINRAISILISVMIEPVKLPHVCPSSDYFGSSILQEGEGRSVWTTVDHSVIRGLVTT
jgi:predicted transposase/invertase (TIGR01784 family)